MFEKLSCIARWQQESIKSREEPPCTQASCGYIGIIFRETPMHGQSEQSQNAHPLLPDSKTSAHSISKYHNGLELDPFCPAVIEWNSAVPNKHLLLPQRENTCVQIRGEGYPVAGETQTQTCPQVTSRSTPTSPSQRDTIPRSLKVLRDCMAALPHVPSTGQRIFVEHLLGASPCPRPCESPAHTAPGFYLQRNLLVEWETNV